MRRKIYMGLLIATMLGVAGCGKKVDDSSSEQSSVVENMTDPSGIEEKEELRNEESSAEITTVAEETGVYPETTGLIELPMGIDNIECTIKVPLNYILGGATITENGAEEVVKGLGATVTVEQAGKDGCITENQALTSFAMTSLDANPTIIQTMAYDSTSVGTIDDMKAIFVEGKEIGDSTMPGWVYKDIESSLNPNADVAMYIQVSDSMLLSVFYEGPVADTVSEDEMAQRVYNLVTKK